MERLRILLLTSKISLMITVLDISAVTTKVIHLILLVIGIGRLTVLSSLTKDMEIHGRLSIYHGYPTSFITV